MHLENTCLLLRHMKHITCWLRKTTLMYAYSPSLDFRNQCYITFVNIFLLSFILLNPTHNAFLVDSGLHFPNQHAYKQRTIIWVLHITHGWTNPNNNIYVQNVIGTSYAGLLFCSFPRTLSLKRMGK